ncbi:hypothetical protein AB3Y40_12305 [Yoonia sp. R2331]|uniref:hypothetical protein n=1 Tax=Yoonia sp. R2331 TaxID=3237238 RepID=UPI0034E3DF00
MPETDNKDEALADAVLRDVACIAPAPDDALMARVMADAARAPELKDHAARGSIWAQLVASVGGWPAAGGLALAGIAGLWVGVAPPASIEDAAAGLFGTTDTVTLWDDGGIFAEEGLTDG